MSVQIRPVFGRGNTQALYQGPVEENGVFIDETKVSLRVAGNAGFWEYIDAAKRAGREVGTCEGGIFSWRLSIQYLDSSGAAAIVDGKTSLVTSEAYEFYRASASADPGESMSVALVQTFKEMVSAHTKLMHGLSTGLAENAQKAVCAAVAAAMAPLNQVVDRVAVMSKEDTTRADEMTKAVVKLLREQQPKPDIFDGIAKAVPAGAMALKAIKDLKN